MEAKDHKRINPDNQIGQQDLPAAAVQSTSAFSYGSGGRPCLPASAGRPTADPQQILLPA